MTNQTKQSALEFVQSSCCNSHMCNLVQFLNCFVLLRLHAASIPQRLAVWGHFKCQLLLETIALAPNYIQSLNENKGKSNHESQPATHLKHRPTHHTKSSPDYRLHNAPTSRRKRAPRPKPMYSTVYFHSFSSDGHIHFTTSSSSVSTLPCSLIYIYI